MKRFIIPAFWLLISILNSWVAIFVDNQQEILLLIIDAILTFAIGMVELARSMRDEQF